MRRLLSMLAAALAIGLPGLAHGAFISYTSSTVNNVPNVLTYTITFGTPILPLPGLASFSFEGYFALTDAGRPPDGVSVAPGSLPEYWRLAVGNAAQQWTTVADVGGTASLVGAGEHDFLASGTFDCASIGGCAWLLITVSYSVGGGGDVVASGGTFTLLPLAVPEPVPAALLVAGLAALAVARRRVAAQAGGYRVRQ